MWFHQHFNAGAKPARYLPLRFGGIKYNMGNGFGDISQVDRNVKQGGNQIEYSDEAPEIRRMFEEKLRKMGMKSQMNPDLYEKELHVPNAGTTQYGQRPLSVPAVKKDGTRVSVEFNVNRDSRDRVLGVAAIIRDVTARWEKIKELTLTKNI